MELTSKLFHSLLPQIDTIVTDCDGVLWIDNDPITDSPETINKLQDLNKRVICITNTSTKHRTEIATKAQRLGFNITSNNIVTSASLAATYLKSSGFKKKIYLMGSNALGTELQDKGIKCVGAGPDPIINTVHETLDDFYLDPDVGGVVIGFDEHFSYVKMMKAASYLSRKKSVLVATNRDLKVVMANVVVPGTGAAVHAVETVANREAVLVGKPGDYVVEALMKQYGVYPYKSLFVSDNSVIDVRLGSRYGFKTLLVLSGVTVLRQVKDWQKSAKKEDEDYVPDYYVGKLGDLLKFMDE